tara:strand:+ start:5853 stop:6929 length:1077 start_codon:yes stop_codon:yes gene_type:complete
MTEVVTNASNLNSPDILKQAFQEYTTSQELAWLMGGSEMAPIQMRVKTGKGSGDTITCSIANSFDEASVRTGTEVLAGNEVDLVLNDDSVTINYVRMAAKVDSKALVNLRTPVEIVGLIRPSIIDTMARKLRNDIIDSAAVTASPVDKRALFGATEANYNATLATALANVDATADKMSVEMIRLVKDMARETSTDAPRKLRPYKARMNNGAYMETFVLLVDGKGARQLQADADFKELRDDSRNNEIAMPYFNGTDYIGQVDGVMVYRVNELARIKHAAAGASGIDVSHALFLGAQAFMVAFGETGQFNDVNPNSAADTDYGRHMKVGYTTIRGTKMLKFDNGAGTDIENGVIHVFHAG